LRFSTVLELCASPHLWVLFEEEAGWRTPAPAVLARNSDFMQ
jgi:hypothetical protein